MDVKTRQAENEITKRPGFKSWFKLCPVRHIAFFASILVIALFLALRGNKALMETISEGLVRPYHRLAGRICSIVDFSVAELLYAAVILGAIAYLVRAVVLFARGENRRRRAYLTVTAFITVIAVIYAGICLVWGVYYYAESFEDKSGIETRPISAEELETVTLYFAHVANEYAAQVGRDDEGLFSEDEAELFDKGVTLYRAAAQKFPFLDGPELRTKPMTFSYIMSYINFTGFFFPFTGEANLNVHSPQCMLPATIAHELAHQRGVSAEDEANFVAILACMESGDPAYRYSAALLAYIHLGNALYKADYDAWQEVYFSLDEAVRVDLSANSAYWAQFETGAAKASEAVYTGFLQSYGQELGMKSYGACVDLLTAYYYDEAQALIN